MSAACTLQGLAPAHPSRTCPARPVHGAALRALPADLLGACRLAAGASKRALISGAKTARVISGMPLHER